MALACLSIPATNLLTTMLTIKDELNISVDTFDDTLYRLLVRASDAIVRECGRWPGGFGIAQYQEILQGSGTQLIELSCKPVLQVTQVCQGTQLTQDLDVMNPNDPIQGYWIEDAEAGAIFSPGGWSQSPSFLSWGAAAYGSRYIIQGGMLQQMWTITYVAGYLLPPQQDYIPYDPTSGVLIDSITPAPEPNIPPVLNNPAGMADPPPLPGDLEQACLATVKSWWFGRARDIAVSAAKSGDESRTYEPSLNNRALPTEALSLLRDYRRVL